MSKLNRPTIDGFVEKLLNDQIIKENEVDKVQLSLEQASKGLNKNEIFTLVSTLNDRLDAASNDLITPNGLNYAGFENVVKEVSNAIVKEKVNREAAEVAKKEVQEAEKLKEQKALEEKAEKERQEIIEKNKRYLEDFIKNTPGMENLNLTDEDMSELAKVQDDVDRYIKLKDELDKQGVSEDEKNKILKRETGRTIDSFDTPEAKAATIVHTMRKFENSEEQEVGEIIENLSGTEQQLLEKAIGSEKFAEMKKQKDKVSVLEMLKLGLGGMLAEFSLKKENNVDKQEKTIETYEAKIRGALFNDNETNAKKILSFLENIESAQISRRENIVKKETLSDKDKIAKNMFFTYITNKYISLDSSVTISSLYERYKNHPKMRVFDMNFEDFICGIQDNLKEHATLTEDNYVLDEMIKIERMIRKSDLLKQAIETAKKNGNEILEEEALKEFDDSFESERKNIPQYKQIFATRKNIDVERIKKNHEKEMKKEISAPKLENDISRINQDREQIIELSKKLRISTDDAAKIYFEKNKERINLYSRKEREILREKSPINKDLNSNSKKTIKKLSIFMKEKNDTLISIYTQEIEDIKKEIEDGKFDIKEFDSKWKKLEKQKSKLEKAQKRDKTIGKMNRSKGTMGVFEEIERKDFEKNIFKKYLHSGKSAYEFLEEFNKSENGTNLSKNELMVIIKNGSRKFMRPEKLTNLIANEETIFKNENLLEKLRLKREHAEKQGLTEWIKECEEQIKDAEKNLQKCMEKTNEAKESIKGMVPKIRGDFGKAKDQAPLESEATATIKQTSENANNERIKNQEFENSSIVSQGIEVSTIETGEGIKPNITAIAKKNKVTSSRIKNAFSKIMELRKSKTTMHEDHEVQDENEIDEQTVENKTANNDDAR